MPTIRTTFEPWREIFVSEDEYLRLLRAGLIFTGATPPAPPAFTDPQYAELANPDGEAARRIIDAVGESALIDGVTSTVLAEVDGRNFATSAALATVADEVDDINGRGYLTSALAYTKSQLATVVRPVTFLDGIDPTGVADSTAALTTAIQNAPDGASIALQTGRYRWSGTSALNNRVDGTGSRKRMFNLDGGGSTIILDGGTTEFLNLSSDVDDPVSVTGAVVASEIDTGSSSQTPAVTFTTGAAMPWSQGDTITLAADNETPGARSPDYAALGDVTTTAASTTLTLAAEPLSPLVVGHAVRFPAGQSAFTAIRDYYIVEVVSSTSFKVATSIDAVPASAATSETFAVTRATSIARVAQVLEVWSVTGTTVVALGKLWGSYTLNVRAARYQPTGVNVRGFRFEYSDARLANPTNLIRATSLIGPRISDISVPKAAGPICDLRDCHLGSFTGIRCDYNRNDTANGFLGYVVLLSSGSSNNKIDAFGRSVRHVGTTDINYVAPASGISAYGACNSNKWTGEGVATSSGAFDTHHASWGEVFHNILVRDSRAAVQLRGFDHVVTNLTGRNNINDVVIFEEDAGRNGVTRRATVTGVTSYDNRSAIVTISKGRTGNWDAGVRVDTPDIISGIRAFSPRGGIVAPTHATYTIGDVQVIADAAIPGIRHFFNNNSVMIQAGDLMLDYSKLVLASNADVRSFTVSGTGEIRLFGKVNIASVSGIPAVVSSSSSTTAKIMIDDLILTTDGGMDVLNVSTIPHADSYVNHRSRTGARSSYFISLSADPTSATLIAPIGRIFTMQAHISTSLTANTTGPTIPAPKLTGMRLTIHNTSSSFTYTIAGSAIAPQTVAMFVYSASAWRRV